MQIKVKAIVLKNTKSGDKDFLVTLFCLEKGIIRAKLKSASMPKAKLKFAKEQFAFADFILTSKNGYFNIITADLIDSFYNICTNYNKFLEANQIFKSVLKIMPSMQPNPSLFVNVLKSLKLLCYENVQENLTLAKFYLQVFFAEGYTLSASACNSCGQKLGQDVFLDFDSGEVLCFSCKTIYAQKISFAISNLLKLLSQTSFESLNTLTVDQLNLENTITILKQNFDSRF